MFNRTYLIPHHTRETVTVEKTVIEKRAPTDESVKLLREMTEAAERQIEKSVKLADTNIECVIHTMRDNVSDDVVTKAIVLCNGQRLVVETRLPHGEPLERRIEKLIAAVAERLAFAVVRPVLARLLVNGR